MGSERKDAAARVRATIAEAFKDVPYPGDDRLEDPEALDRVFCEQAANVVRGKHWSKLTTQDLWDIDSLCWLSLSAVHYYLPGYMDACIRDYEAADWAVDHVIYYLTPGKRRPGSAERIAKHLSRPQASAVADFLDLLATEHGEDYPDDDPRIASEYWKHVGSEMS